jgi:hypothetical protein
MDSVVHCFGSDFTTKLTKSSKIVVAFVVDALDNPT